MSRYTKSGDKGTTNLFRTKNVSKSDDRIELTGTIEELTSHLGLVKTMLADADAVRMLEKIQRTLLSVTAGVSDPYSKDYRIPDEATEILEDEIERLDALFTEPKGELLPGVSRLSAEIDVARAVARRAERAYASVSVKFGGDNGAKKYLNRLADYLYILARYADETGGVVNVSAASEGRGQAASVMARTKPSGHESAAPRDRSPEKAGQDVAVNAQGTTEEQVVREVLRQMGIQGKITLDGAKRLIEKIEEEANRRGKKAVIAVCGPDGNPIAVHVMDGAFLVSFDVAVKKAYTSVAVKMSTMELNALAQPGGTFYGLDKMEGGNIIIFGGGVPLKAGDTIIGGLGVSGGTGEEDHSLAEYGLSVLQEVL